MNRDTLAHATRPRTDDHTVTSSNSDHPSNIANWVQCTRAREDARRINGDRNCETASALSALDKRKWASDAPAGTATTSTGSEIMIVGDFRTGYAIVDRISMTMEIIQHLYGPTNRFPTGQRSAHTPSCVRVANGLRLARSGISKSRELILVRGGVSFKEANVAVGHHMILVSGGAGFTFPWSASSWPHRVNVTSCVLWFHD
jgi:hypothetical protein